MFISDLRPGFNGLGKNNYNARGETFKFWDLVWLILEIWRYMFLNIYGGKSDDDSLQTHCHIYVEGIPQNTVQIL